MYTEHSTPKQENTYFLKFIWNILWASPHVIPQSKSFFFFFKDFIYFIFREGKGGRKRKREKYHCVVASLTWLPWGDLARNPGMGPDWESNRRPFGLQPVLNPLSHASQGTKQVLINFKRLNSNKISLPITME